MVKHYINNKQVYARPMTKIEWFDYRGWDISDRDLETAEAPGYLVEDPMGEPNHADHAGRLKWIPASTFEADHAPVDNLHFGHVIQLLKQGHAAFREGQSGVMLHDGRIVITHSLKPYRPSNEDMLADDWVMVRNDKTS